ncbi:MULTISPECIES: hypothetical protein [Cysteiniphilum]|uniref:Uncharacterized protein n=1 Tax=Cysteiniphilum litorale TaxID=2056700 RepID=A0A8J2Z5W2_9GAMM|nr:MULTISPECIES: hypothetical protein [Cysteiniphilum]GGG03169.1 hypothetical protein GCM10010995_20770 [Cysteiniphilum litorale]
MNELQKITDWKYVTTDKAKHIFAQLEKELDTSLETQKVLDDKLFKLLSFSIVAIPALFTAMQFTKVSAAIFIIAIGFLVCMLFCLLGVYARKYRARAEKPSDYMCTGVIDEPYRLFLYADAMSFQASISENIKSNQSKSKCYKLAIVSLFVGFSLSTLILAVACLYPIHLVQV